MFKQKFSKAQFLKICCKFFENIISQNIPLSIVVFENLNNFYDKIKDLFKEE